ncbi:MAG: cbb3-type cytochrome c oxidase subunit I [Bradymonadaceae bacterium]|nr:cbb3-type cytochrome c oxidase subunit I [Lujinxingiaceae bacterium]
MNTLTHRDTLLAVRRWLILAVVSMLFAGLLSLMLIIGRLPPFSGWLTDPMFFRRCLVVHVDLALIVWFYAFATALFLLLPSGKPSKRSGHMALVGAGGVLAMVLSAGFEGAAPVLANYVPVLDHGLFLAGLFVFGASVVITLFDGRLLAPGAGPTILPRAAITGLKAMAAVVFIATLVFVISFFETSRALEAEVYYELLFWGGGHVLQVASVLTMLVVWLILLTGLLGREPMGRRTSGLLFGLLVAPQLGAPLLALAGTSSPIYHTGFSRLMQFGIVVPVLVFLGLCLRAVWTDFAAGKLGGRGLLDPRLVGFLASALLCVLGFVLGAMISGSNTMIPAHYHASLGAVTVSLMTVTFALLEPLGFSLGTGRLPAFARVQPLIFGVGQVIFAMGFAIAGAYGLGRKAYAGDQIVRASGEVVGLVVMGAGGLMAIAGGLLFLVLTVAAWRLNRSTYNRSSRWKNPRFTPYKN